MSNINQAAGTFHHVSNGCTAAVNEGFDDIYFLFFLPAMWMCYMVFDELEHCAQ